jgi:elongation factor G
MPIGSESEFTGVIDLIERKAIIWQDDLGTDPIEDEIPDNLKQEAETRRAAMVELIVEQDDNLTERFLDGEEISSEELTTGLRNAVLAGHATPVFCGSSLRNKGVQLLLDGIVKYLPSPLDIPPVDGLDPNSDKVITREASDEAPLSALVFKIVTDPYVGRLAYLRVYSGKVTQGSKTHNSTKGKRERIGRLLRMYADHREDVEEVLAGDIVAVLGMKNTFTGDTICDAANPIVLENITFPEPVIFLAIEPKTMADQDKMSEALRKLSEEDPTFRVGSDENTGQTVIWGMGELHLEVLVDRMLREFRVQAKIGIPRVAYRESISQAVPETEYRYVKQTGGRGHFAHVVIGVEPAARGEGISFEDKTRGGSIPREFIPAVENGVRQSAESGTLAGYPATDIKVTLLDGSFHEVDSSAMAFQMAGSLAYREAVQRAKPILLEPVMRVEVIVPDDNLGDVTGDLSSRRANIEGIEGRPTGIQAIRVLVPLAEMFGYATDLRSMTKGRGVFTMEFDHYHKVTEQVTKSVLVGVR